MAAQHLCRCIECGTYCLRVCPCILLLCCCEPQCPQSELVLALLMLAPHREFCSKSLQGAQ